MTDVGNEREIFFRKKQKGLKNDKGSSGVGQKELCLEECPRPIFDAVKDRRPTDRRRSSVQSAMTYTLQGMANIRGNQT